MQKNTRLQMRRLSGPSATAARIRRAGKTNRSYDTKI